MKTITVDDLCERLRSTGEFAVIDPREEGLFTFSHLLAATNLPLSRLELTIGDAVPDIESEIVLVDDLTGASQRAYMVLNDLGYSNVVALEGGTTAWGASGLPLFSGINVPGKAFGEYIEQEYRPPAISARALRQRLESDVETILIDTRTPEEHADYCIPGAVLCPNGELGLRALPVVANEDTVVVTHCAGRTRSIIGAQTLRDLGVTAPVFALENGTIAWEDEGCALETGAQRPMDVTEASRNAGQQAVRRLAQEHDVASVDKLQVDEWRLGKDGRTTYVIDVRAESEYDRGHWSGARHVPGGQLVQNIDRYVVVRNARVVLVDDDGVRALTAAAWLTRMGLHEVYAATMPDDDSTVTETQSIQAEFEYADVEGVASALDQSDTMVLDIRSSLSYRRGHLAGSYFLTRENLVRDKQNLPDKSKAIVVSDDARYASLMVRDLKNLNIVAAVFPIEHLRAGGGPLPVEKGMTNLASPPSDMHYDAEAFDNIVAKARENRRYIDWEIALIDDIRNEPSVRFL